MGRQQEFEKKRLQHVADYNELNTPADLEAFLATDPKTKDDEPMRNYVRMQMQNAVPRLKP